MLSKAWDYINVNKMIEKGDRIVVGVSGGADSVCLLYVLDQYCRENGTEIIVVHINHGIRGEEALRDETFVRDLCKRIDVPFYGFSYDVKKLSKELGLSEEETGRKVRYEAFLEICKIKGCNKIAIAHNRNDNAETVLFHLFRGSGMRGLSGINPMRDMNTDYGKVIIIRPLLCVERKEIEEYLEREDIDYQTDSTNLTDDYSRNKIRNRILSYAVDQINSGAIGNIAEAALQLREAQDYIDEEINMIYPVLVKQWNAVYRININDFLLKAPVIQKGILLRIMENLAGMRKNLEAKHVEAVLSLLSKQVGRLIHLPYGIIAEREYDDIKLSIEEKSDHNIVREEDTYLPIAVTIPGITVVPKYRKILETELIDIKNNRTIPKSSCVKWFDYDKIENTVELRTRRIGDFIQVNRIGGSKKLKDYFIDHKIPRDLRDGLLLIADGSHVMWIYGVWDRMSEKYKVDENTKRVLSMKMLDLEESVDDR